ncbi:MULTISPECIES: hypothetical protein [Sorangium]|uniref:Uncharacterized protein n=1 Tax=Sorangium cellulosum TaxID=56 RepID=A0A4P2QQ34_SORCE|nr:MULTISPECIES: hypothetical protein [Sorangium]AUX32289.1 hypothetical protein SOCE836_044260 [Sorangium cellulosum]WCQ91663.1 hypothetical protein NQZ70_04386 [Sorangium sp. Soce836]
MPRISDATLRAQIPTALLIGGDQALLERCQAAAMDVGIVVKACPVSMAAALAEERRPVAIVVTSSTYALAPEGFEEIARDVVSTLVRVDETLTDDELGAMLGTAARESRKQRSWQLTPGRYSLTPGDDGTGPCSERWTLGGMTDAPSRRDAEATPLPRSGPRSAGAQELAFRERVAAAVASQRPERWAAGGQGEAPHRPLDPAAPRAERLGVMALTSRARRELPSSPPAPAPTGVVVARRDASVPPADRAGAYARRDTPMPASQPAGGYARRDTPMAGSQLAATYSRGATLPAAAHPRRDTPAPLSQPAAAYLRRQPGVAVPRRDTPAPLSQPAAPGSWQAAGAPSRRETLAPSSRPAAPSSRQAAPSSRQEAGAPSRREALVPSSRPAAPSSRPAAPLSQPAVPSSRREAQLAGAPLRRETPVSPSQRGAGHPQPEMTAGQMGAAPSQREALAPGALEGEAYGSHSTPPPSSHRAPPSSRRAQFHVDIALLFDERGLPRADPEEK